MAIVRDVLDDGLGGLEHNFLTGRVEDLVLCLGLQEEL